MAQIEALCTSQANAELQLCAAQSLMIAQSWISNATRIWDCEVSSVSERNPCPGGTRDNSPTFQRWGTSGKDNLVPKGRLRALRHMPGRSFEFGNLPLPQGEDRGEGEERVEIISDGRSTPRSMETLSNE